MSLAQDTAVAPPQQASNFGKWMALAAALLGWLFDGLEMGLFPLVARPALSELLTAEYGADHSAGQIPVWLGVITALFLVGAATGGVLFGWLGDRFGRVKAMMLSVLTYALVSGLCGFATSAWQIGVLRFIASLGMGGEWSLGVALVNEIWPDRSRAFLAGLIGAAANCGYLAIALVGYGLGESIQQTQGFLLQIGLPATFVERILANNGWRFLMMLGAVPALLTFFIRIFVPESQRWEHERDKGVTSHWAPADLLGVLVGGLAACGIIFLWTPNAEAQWTLTVRTVGSIVLFAIALVGYTYPVHRFLARSESPDLPDYHRARPTFQRMLLGACLSGVALLGTWGSAQQAAPYTNGLIQKNERDRWQQSNPDQTMPDEVKATILRQAQAGASHTLAWASFGAIVGTLLAAMLANRMGRRPTYFLLCLGSLVIIPGFFLTRTVVDPFFYFLVFLMGAITASFYGWLPLYLPEIFRTSVRATGQGFGFNFGRVLAAIGVLQLGNLTAVAESFRRIVPEALRLPPEYGGLPYACASLSLIYVVGMVLIWVVPETKGQPLPE
jgi:MFS family permease